MTKNKRPQKHSAGKKKAPNKKSHFLLRFLPKNKKSTVKAALIILALVGVAGAVHLPYSFTKSLAIPFSVENKNNAELELGDSKIIQEGNDGRKTIHIESLQSIWGGLFGMQPIHQKEIGSTTTKTPTAKIIANGTKKYQYMVCSDGSFRYYTDEQFKDPQTGFTSKSEDYCKENNQGYKVSLSDSSPSSSSTVPSSKPPSSTQPDTYAADKIKRETEKLLWCAEQEEKIGNEYISKVHQAQAMKDITNQEFNAIVDPAYWKYSLNFKSLKSSGCAISNPYPDFTR